MGLISGTIPFLLKGLTTSEGPTSYTALSLLSLASQPYNLKLLWSPLVDSLYVKRLGRRKSWIIPLQLLVGLCFLYAGWIGPDLSVQGEGPVPMGKITAVSAGLGVLCATQDIAVDGWALTLLDRDYAKYSSTFQTIGLNAGYFFAFTVYLSQLAQQQCCHQHSYIYQIFRVIRLI